MDQNKHPDWKKIGIIALCVFILLLPLIAAIIVHACGPIDHPQPDPNKPKTELVLHYPDGSEKTAAPDDADGTYALVRKMIADSTPIAKLPADVDKNSPLTATFTDADGKTEVYTCYLSSDPYACYYVDGDKKAHNIAPDDARGFLARADLAAFVTGDEPAQTDPSGSGTTTGTDVPEPTTGKPDDPVTPPDVNFVLPVLTFNSSSVIKPAVIDWYAADTTGAFHNKNETSSEQLSFNLSNESEIALVFDIPPSDCQVKAYDTVSGVILYDGTYSRISLAKIAASTRVKFDVSANWKHDQNSTYYGSASYTFFANVDVQVHAQFKVNRTTLNLGEFVLVSGINADDVSKIKVTSNPALNYTPIFFTEEVNGITVVNTILPFSYGLDKGTYDVTFEYGGDSQTIRLTVNDYTNKYIDGPSTQISTYTQKLVTEVCTQAALDQYRYLFADVTSTNETQRYFGKEAESKLPFLDFRTKGVLTKTPTLRMGFARHITITNASGAFSYDHDGWDFEVASGVEVPAMKGGRVAYVGESDLLGKCVVIDHGFGLKTWYAHLSEFSVTVGGYVSSGQTIGKTGTTGLASAKYRLHIGVSVYDVPVAPDSVFNGKYLTFPKFN